MDANEHKYLSLLAKSFPTVAKAQAEIINLNAILNLPKAVPYESESTKHLAIR